MTRVNQEVLLLVNEQAREVLIRPAETLLETLRNRFQLTGAKPGCENGDCGACTVLVNAQPHKSCLILTIELAGTHQQITTVEGLHNTPIQEAFSRNFAFQCGYCTPGFLINAHALLLREPNPTDETISEWLESNICRCTSYEEIERAVKSAVRYSGTTQQASLATSARTSKHPPPSRGSTQVKGTGDFAGVV